MGDEEIALYVAAESALLPAEHARQERLRHWAAEAASLTREPIHLRILGLSRRADFRADCRWIARELNVNVDEVNIAFSRLLRLRLIAANGAEKWMDLTGMPHLAEREFLDMALARVRESACDFEAKSSAK